MTSLGSSETADVLVLALDTSTSQGGVALVEGSPHSQTLRAKATWQRLKSHSEFLTPTIQTVLDEAGSILQDVDAIAVGRGPGSFTGIRISISAVKGLAYALQKPVYAFDTLQILANAVTDTSRPILSLVNAHKNLLFANLYDWTGSLAALTSGTSAGVGLSHLGAGASPTSKGAGASPTTGEWRARGEIKAMSLDELARLVQEPILCVGDGYLEYQEHFPLELKQLLNRNALFADEPSPETLGKMALVYSGTHQALEWNSLQALYIRASGAEESLETKHR